MVEEFNGARQMHCDAVSLTRYEAEELARRAAGPHYALEPPALEASYGWVFRVRPRRQVFGGRDHVVVEAEGGRVYFGNSCTFGHSHGSDHERGDVLEAYERGFRFDRYDITISTVADLKTTAKALVGLQYVVPEDTGDAVWTIPQNYTEVELVALLTEAPITFRYQSLGPLGSKALADYFDRMRCCTYSLAGRDVPAPSSRWMRDMGPAPARARAPQSADIERRYRRQIDQPIADHTSNDD